VLNESDVTTVWRKLFQGQEITDETLIKAEELLDELTLASPLRVRLATELEEIRKLREKS